LLAFQAAAARAWFHFWFHEENDASGISPGITAVACQLT
jgi:hypothetical protein